MPLSLVCPLLHSKTSLILPCICQNPALSHWPLLSTPTRTLTHIKIPLPVTSKRPLSLPFQSPRPSQCTPWTSPRHWQVTQLPSKVVVGVPGSQACPRISRRAFLLSSWPQTSRVTFLVRQHCPHLGDYRQVPLLHER